MQSEADTAGGESALHPVPDPARARLRDLIRREVAARRPRPIARRTLELLAESAIEPAEGEPPYRVVDRRGEPRSRMAEEGGAAEPLTLAEVLAELQERHPALFEPPLPEPEPVEASESGASETAAAQAARLRGDAARYIELQSAKARVVTRAVAARSTEKGRSLAASAGAAYAALRAKAAGRATRPDSPLPAGEQAAPGLAAPLPDATEPSVPLGDRLRGRAGDVLARGRDALGQVNDHLDGRWILGSATAAAVVTAAVVLVGTAREGADMPAREPSPDTARAQPPAARPDTAQAPPQSPAQAAKGEPPRDSAPPDAEPAQGSQASPATPPPEEEPEAPAPLPGDVAGPAEVVDTATLRIGGRTVRLFGVEWVRGGNAADLTRYLAGRPVSCQRAPGSENHLCQVEGRDLSEVVLFNGGGRASPEASPDLAAAEDHARTERLGIWKR
ncbi:nuclease [Methylobacterium sp. sgz302541]|uniref:nuclease n=1 Tax=unclassified Methylobacterium TaxID=2615210 RepID=UPI003D352296